jgi:hypothetical protein
MYKRIETPEKIEKKSNTSTTPKQLDTPFNSKEIHKTYNINSLASSKNPSIKFNRPSISSPRNSNKFRESVISFWKVQKRKSSDLLNHVSVNSESQSGRRSQFSTPQQVATPNNHMMFSRLIGDFNMLYENLYQMNAYNYKGSDMAYTHFDFNPFFYQRQSIHNIRTYNSLKKKEN